MYMFWCASSTMHWLPIKFLTSVGWLGFFFSPFSFIICHYWMKLVFVYDVGQTMKVIANMLNAWSTIFFPIELKLLLNYNSKSCNRFFVGHEDWHKMHLLVYSLFYLIMLAKYIKVLLTLTEPSRVELLELRAIKQDNEKKRRKNNMGKEMHGQPSVCFNKIAENYVHWFHCWEIPMKMR